MANVFVTDAELGTKVESYIPGFAKTLNKNTIDGTKFEAIATTFDVSDLRLAFQIQKWMERNARAGVRYTEFLKAHYGVQSDHSKSINQTESLPYEMFYAHGQTNKRHCPYQPAFLSPIS